MSMLLPHLFAAPALSLSIGQLGQLLNSAFGSLGGQINMWLIGVVFAPMVYLLGWQSGLGPALGVGSYYASTPLFPWQLPTGTPFPNGLAFAIGLLAFGFVALKLIADLVDG